MMVLKLNLNKVEIVTIHISDPEKHGFNINIDFLNYFYIPVPISIYDRLLVRTLTCYIFIYCKDPERCGINTSIGCLDYCFILSNPNLET